MTTLKQLFQSQGYLVLEGFNTAEACDALMKRGEELANAYAFDGHASIFQTADQAKTSDEYFISSANKISFFFEKDSFDENGRLVNDLFHSMNKIGHALHDLDPLFDQFSRSAAMKKLAAELGLEGSVIIQSMLILKHAKVGGNVDIHQDASFLYTEPESCIGFWFALEDASAENGCLWARPGGHQTNLRARFRNKDTGAVLEVLVDEPFSMDGMIPLEVKKGTCIVLHGLLPHCSLPNTSGRSRQAYAIHSIDREAQYPADNWLQRNPGELRGFY